MLPRHTWHGYVVGHWMIVAIIFSDKVHKKTFFLSESVKMSDAKQSVSCHCVHHRMTEKRQLEAMFF